MFHLLKTPVVLVAALLSMIACSEVSGPQTLLPSSASATSEARTPSDLKIQPASFVTVTSSANFQSIPLNGQALENDLLSAEPIVGSDYMLQPVIPTGPIVKAEALRRAPKQMIPVIGRTIEYHPINSLRRPWSAGLFYGTTFGQHPLIVAR